MIGSYLSEKRNLCCPKISRKASLSNTKNYRMLQNTVKLEKWHAPSIPFQKNSLNILRQLSGMALPFLVKFQPFLILRITFV